MWSGLTLCTDNDLGAIEPLAIAADAPWGATTWSSARAEAKRELRILIETMFSDVKHAADRVLDVHRPDIVLSAIGGAFADLTAQAVDRSEDDVHLTTIFADAANRLYIGADYQFEGIAVLMKDALNAQTPRTLTAKCSAAAGFTAISGVSDGTAVSSKTFAQSGRISWATVPAAWHRRIVGSTPDPLFWVELSIDTALSAGSTKAAQILTVRAPDGLKRVATMLSLYYVLNGLERQAAKPDDWRDKAKAYREEALSLFQLLKEHGGIPLDSNRDQVITSAEVVNVRPVRLGRA